MSGAWYLAPSQVVIGVDVLSFTTSVDVVLGRGAVVLPYCGKDDSATVYARAQNAELARPRGQGEGSYSLAPSSLLNAPAWLRLVLPSPNGSSLCFVASKSGATVVARCLRNASAIAAWAAQAGTQISVVPAGEQWPDGTLRPAFEDLVGAGAILRVLPGRRSPEAQSSVAAYEDAALCLHERLLACASGKELIERGFEQDVELAFQRDISTIVPVLKDGAFAPSTLV